MCSLLAGLGMTAGTIVQAQHLRLHDVIRSALAANPSLQMQEQQVRGSEGAWQATLGQFDPQLNASLTGIRDHEAQANSNAFVATDASTYSLRLQKQFRSGLTVTPGVSMIRQDLVATGGTLNSASVGFSVLMPLLRDRGVQATAARERAARHTYDASRADLHHRRAEVVLQATLAYWQYRAAWKILNALRESEARARTLMEETTVLIEADERPAADRDQLEANLAAKTAQRIAAEQQLFEAEQQVGLAMGLPFEQMKVLGEPIDAFPPVNDSLLTELAQSERFIDMVTSRRADLKASQTRERAMRLALQEAQNELKPRLDLSLDLGYAGLESGTALEQYFTPFGRNVGGLNVGVTLTYDLPVRNRAAEGFAMQRASLYQQQQIAARDLDRFVRSGVLVALKALERSIYELKSSEAAITLYRIAVANEKKKFQIGLATLIDVINVEDRLTEALLSYASGQQRYAGALVQLRFETGTLIPPEPQPFDLDRVTTLPHTQLP